MPSMRSWEMNDRLPEGIVCAGRHVTVPLPRTAGLDADQQLRPYKKARW